MPTVKVKVMESKAPGNDVPALCWQGGSRSPLVILSGGFPGRLLPNWATLLSILGDNFSVYTVEDNRANILGSRAVESPKNCLARLLDSFAEPDSVFAHCYGAAWALEAVSCTANIHRLILCELPPERERAYPSEVSERMAALFDTRHWDDLLATHYRDVVHMPEHDMEVMRSQRIWPALGSMAYLIFRDFYQAPGETEGMALFNCVV